MAISDMAVGVQNAIQQQLMRRMQQQQAIAQQQEAQRKAELEARSADRADAGMALQYQQADALTERQGRQDQIAADDRAFTQGNTLAEQVPGGTFLPEGDPTAAKLPSYLLQGTPERPAMGDEFAGPMPGGETPQQAQVGRPGGFIKTRTFAQRNTEGDDERAAQIAAAQQAHQARTEDRAVGAEERAVGTAAEAARHNRVMENRPTGGGGDDLSTFEAKEQIKAKYAGARPSVGAERQTLNYFNRMLQAEKDARRVEDKLGGSDLAAQQYAPGWLENWIQSEEGQQYTQAQRSYTEARLRKESGAAIPPHEFDSDRKTNFRIAGDKGPDVMKQKRGMRLQTLRGIGNASGRALQEYYGADSSLEGLLKEFADQPSSTVAMRAPDGRRLNVPADKVAELEKAGATRQ